MKTLLMLLLLACGLATAQDCNEPPRLRTQYLTDYEGGAVWLWIWGPTVCTNWTFEVSEDLRTWRAFRGYWGNMHYVCTNDAKPNECLRYAMERTTERQQFYRLRLDKQN